jgi:hypothetical protein
MVGVFEQRPDDGIHRGVRSRAAAHDEVTLRAQGWWARG